MVDTGRDDTVTVKDDAPWGRVHAALVACLLGALAASADAGKLPFKWARGVPKNCEATRCRISADPYGAKMRRVNCCVDDWWSEPASIGTIFAGGCPADLTCNQ